MPNTTVIEYKKTDDETLVKAKLAINEEKKKNMFRGTIAISVVYGLFAFMLIIITAFNNTMRDILFNKYLAFTLIFIVGTIVIIMMMLYFIFSYVPVNISIIDDDDNISCPDYWKVEIVDDSVISRAFDPTYPKNLFKYKCIMDDNIYDKSTLFKYSSNTLGTGLKYTNILSNITQGSSGNKSTGMYKLASDTDFNTDYNNYKNVANIYANINEYDPTTPSNPDYIKKFLNTNSDTIANNTFSNLQEIAYIHNNYKFDDDKKATLTDVISMSNIYSKSPSVLSPVTWNYSNVPTTAITTTTHNTIILDWRNLTPLRAFNLATPIGREIENKKTRKLYVYYTADGTAVKNVYLGTIEITYDIKTDPNYTMIYKTDGTIKYTNLATIPAIPKSIIKVTDTSKNINITTSPTSTSDLNGNSITNIITQLDINEYPVIQFYNINIERPTSITRANSKASNVPLLCDEIYPSFLASYDNANGNNNLRCAYSKICGIPWSDLRCDHQQQI
jgi:hypothetical protein